MQKYFKYSVLCSIMMLLIGFMLPQNLIIPVEGAGREDWNKHSFWHHPWGKSITHKGIDIFARKGTSVISASSGIVWYTGKINRGGNVVMILGPKWRFHYYAHLDSISVKNGSFVSKGSQIGTVGNSGNAAGKPPHLHYAICALFPHFWKADGGIQGSQKMFYMNPDEELP